MAEHVHPAGRGDLARQAHGRQRVDDGLARAQAIVCCAAMAKRRALYPLGAAALSLLLLTGCAPSPSDTPEPSIGITPSASPTGQPVPSGPIAVRPSDAPSPGPAAGLVLAEIRFDPAPGEPGFIEVTNAGATAVDVSGATLEIADRAIALSATGDPLEPGERRLVTLDAATGVALGRTAGNVSLLDADGRRLDRVAWGEGEANAVSMVVGDFVPDHVEPGTTIGRPPGSNTAFSPTAWVRYSPALATPGAPNPVPPVEVLLPIDGAIIEGPEATLDWYASLGATSYRVQVAADETFAAPVLDTTVTEPVLDIGALPAGRYVWRVTAIAGGLTTSAVSASSRFERAPEGVAEGLVRLAAYSGDPRAARVEPTLDDTPGKHLSVPWLVQRKDTSMLLLERPEETGAHPWDALHAQASRDDPADQMNCSLAMIVMLNHFYGGDLSQDRLGYEVFKDRQPGRPEEDLNYGYGTDPDQTEAAFAFALGVGVTSVPTYTSYDLAWADITASIDAGRPVAGAGLTHGFVITGYAVANGHRIINVNDPARFPPYSIDLDALPPRNSRLLSLWLMPANVTARDQEAGVTKDSDGDGVVDFDETERFRTNPAKKDSDADKVPDKQDIVAGVFDAAHGYAAHREDGGRDWDGDGIATELDPDSDGDDCQDGQEDRDLDGHRNGSETWNFDIGDGACHALMGTINIERTSTIDTGSGDASRLTGLETLKATVRVAMEPDPNDPNALIDAGSTFTVERRITFERQVGGDCSPEASISKSDGTYRFSDPPVPSAGHTIDELGGEGGSKIWGMVDRTRRLMMISMVAWYPETVSATCQLMTFPGLPVVIDSWACGQEFLGFPGLGVDAKIKDQPAGPYPVTVECKFEGDAFNWDFQKVVATGQLKLTAE